MRYLSLFSGIEAATVAWAPFGWQAVAFSEIDPFCCALLDQYYPEIPNLGDIDGISENVIKDMGPIDIVVFGFPCQDLSVAGKRAGLKGERSGLFFKAMDIVRWSGARFALAENVPGLFSSNEGRDFATVVGEMAGVEFDIPPNGWDNTGVALGPDGLVEWCVLDAQWFGLAQRRKRVFLVRDTGDWVNRPPILFNSESLSWNSPPSREKGQSVAGTVRGGTESGSNEPNDKVAMARESGQGYWMEDQISGTLDMNMGASGHGNRPAVIADSRERERE